MMTARVFISNFEYPTLQESPSDARVMGSVAIIPKWPSAVILNFIQPEIAPFDPPTPKTLARTKHGVDRMHRLRDIHL